jgi:hypothetical protein
MKVNELFPQDKLNEGITDWLRSQLLKPIKRFLNPGQKKELKIIRDKLSYLENLQKRMNKAQFEDEYEKLKAEYERVMAEPDNRQPGENEYTYDTLVNKIKTECSDILSELKNTSKVLYRGIKGKGEVFVGRPRTDREPRDSSKINQVYYNAWLKRKGIAARRDNSLFVTSHRALAWSFAEGNRDNVYVIFPKNGFKFSWSVNHDDIVIDAADLVNKVLLSKIDDKVYEKYDENSKQVLNTLRGTENLLSAGQMSAANALIDYLNQLDIPEFKNLTVENFYPDGRFDEYYNVIDTELDRAILSGHEICIAGEYIAVRESLFNEIRNQIGLGPATT